MTRYLKNPSEWLMIIAGILILASVPLIAGSEQFMLWFAAKGLYLAGVIAMFTES